MRRVILFRSMSRLYDLLSHVVDDVADGVALGGQARRREHREADRGYLQGLYQERQ